MPRKAKKVEPVMPEEPKQEIIVFPPKTWIPVNAFFAATDINRRVDNGG